MAFPRPTQLVPASSTTWSRPSFQWKHIVLWAGPSFAAARQQTMWVAPVDARAPACATEFRPARPQAFETDPTACLEQGPRQRTRRFWNESLQAGEQSRAHLDSFPPSIHAGTWTGGVPMTSPRRTVAVSCSSSSWPREGPGLRHTCGSSFRKTSRLTHCSPTAYSCAFFLSPRGACTQAWAARA